MSNTNPVLDVKSLTVTYEQKPAILDIHFQAHTNELLGIIGPNGAGKTTLLKSIIGLIKTNSGDIKTFGTTVKKSLTRISYVPQRQTIDWDFPIKVIEVALMGRYGKLGLFRRPKLIDYQIAQEAVDRVGLTKFANSPISELSGGQQQRTFLARALAQEADLYLMDEPFSGLDISTEISIIDILKELRSDGKTILVVHHDLSTVEGYFDHVLLINKKLFATGETKKVFTKENLNRVYEGRFLTLGS